MANPAPAAGPEVLPTLLAVVSESTGYPTEMLTLDMDLEADLVPNAMRKVLTQRLAMLVFAMRVDVVPRHLGKRFTGARQTSTGFHRGNRRFLRA